MTAPRPAEYAEDYGELVRAYRFYMGITPAMLAKKMALGERSLTDIEIGRRSCPPGFIDSVQKVVDEFDAAVSQLNAAADLTGEEMVIEVTSKDEWTRAVVGRAAYESGLIRPVLTSQRHP